MTSKVFQQLLLLLLAIIFSVALMFSFTELPLLFNNILECSPRMDQGLSELNAYKSEMFITSLHLRIIGYSSLAIVFLFIILGFATKKSGWAWAGAFVIFLPVFGNFALSMFFLAGLGMLRVGWLPFWDNSLQLLDLGNIIYVPYWVLMWIFDQFNYYAKMEIAWAFMGSGAFLFTWGVLVWFRSRFANNGVASSWIYRISRHPQYLGWIIWSYGLVIYAPTVNNMKKTWGMSSSLPWLLMTMIIIGICMLEELNMQKKYRGEYDEYRDRTPFLFPLPKWLRKIINFPMWLLIRKNRPEKRREIVGVITIYTIILMGLSFLWTDNGPREGMQLFESKKLSRLETLTEKIHETNARRTKWFLMSDMEKFGDLAVQPMIGFLDSDSPDEQEFATEILGRLGDTSAIPHLRPMMWHPWDGIRSKAIGSLVQLGDSSVLPLLAEMLRTGSSNCPRSTIYRAFGEFKTVVYWDLLVEGSLQGDDWTRMSAVSAMAKIDAAKTTPYLIPLFDSKERLIRSDAVALANILGDKSTLPYLEKLLKDEDADVRIFARIAIKNISKE